MFWFKVAQAGSLTLAGCFRDSVTSWNIWWCLDIKVWRRCFFTLQTQKDNCFCPARWKISFSSACHAYGAVQTDVQTAPSETGHHETALKEETQEEVLNCVEQVRDDDDDGTKTSTFPAELHRADKLLQIKSVFIGVWLSLLIVRNNPFYRFRFSSVWSSSLWGNVRSQWMDHCICSWLGDTWRCVRAHLIIIKNTFHQTGSKRDVQQISVSVRTCSVFFKPNRRVGSVIEWADGDFKSGLMISSCG